MTKPKLMVTTIAFFLVMSSLSVCLNEDKLDQGWPGRITASKSLAGTKICQNMLGG